MCLHSKYPFDNEDNDINLLAGLEGDDEDDDVLANNPLARPLQRIPQNTNLDECLEVCHVQYLYQAAAHYTYF